MEREDAKVGMRVYCANSGEWGYIVSMQPKDYVGCMVQLDHGGYSRIWFSNLRTANRLPLRRRLYEAEKA